MAKKAKKSVKKAKKAKKAAAKLAPLSEVVRLFEVIAQKPNATAAFITAADARKASIGFDESTKRFIRRFLATNNMLKKPSAEQLTASAGTAAAAPPPGDRFKCF